MSEIKKIATRVSYGNALAELGEIYKDICVLDADLAASTQTAIFGKRFTAAAVCFGCADR